MYMAFCLSIGIPEERFWRMTPIKIAALMTAHAELNGANELPENGNQTEEYDQ